MRRAGLQNEMNVRKQFAKGGARRTETDEQVQSGDLGCPSTSSAKLIKKTQIARNLEDAVSDPSALAYFLQFMDSIDQMNLLKFWLEVESFRVSASSVLNSNVVRRSDAHSEPQPQALQQMTREDAGNIFAKYIGQDAAADIGVTQSIKSAVIDFLSREDGVLHSDCFKIAQDFVFEIMKNRYFDQFKSSIYYSNHVIDVMTSDAVELEDVLRNETALSFFTEFQYLDRVGGGCRRLVEFWLAAEGFKESIFDTRDNSCAADQAQGDAMILYDKYFSMQATHPLTLPDSDSVRIGLEIGICSEDGPGPDCFNREQRTVCSILNKEHFANFLRSDLFNRYLRELIYSRDHILELPNPRLRRKFGGSATGSDRSSEQSFYSTRSHNGYFFSPIAKRNSLVCGSDASTIGNASGPLFGDLSKARTTKTAQPPTTASGSGQGSSSDTLNSCDDGSSSKLGKHASDGYSLCNRSSLRATTGSSSLALVDEFGKYRRGFNDKFVPDSMTMTKKQKLKHKLDSIVHPIDPKEEEMADELAMLIISDIKRQTGSAAQ